MLELPPSLSRSAAQDLLADPDTYAFAALTAAASLLGEDLLDEEGQPYLEEELELMLEVEGAKPAPETLSRIAGLLFTVSGEECLADVDHFRRSVSAIVEGDILTYDEEPPSLADVFWALYQIGLTVEEDVFDDLEEPVARYLEALAEEEAEDAEGFQTYLAAQGEEITPEELEPYVSRLLIFRRQRLAEDLRRLGCKPDWMLELDEDLAAAMALGQS